MSRARPGAAGRRNRRQWKHREAAGNGPATIRRGPRRSLLILGLRHPTAGGRPDPGPAGGAEAVGGPQGRPERAADPGQGGIRAPSSRPRRGRSTSTRRSTTPRSATPSPNSWASSPESGAPSVVEVHEGAVKLDGQVDDDDTLDDVTAFAQKVEGVRLVLNRMKTDAEVLTGREMAVKVLREYRGVVAKNWLLALLAVGFALAFGDAGEGLRPLLGDAAVAVPWQPALLRSVVGSLLSSLIVLAGILLALSVLNLTHAVVSVLGLAGVVGLALGFAFRDIAENFIASMLLGLRQAVPDSATSSPWPASRARSCRWTPGPRC